MILSRCRRCGARPQLVGMEAFWTNGRWYQHRHPEIYCARCGNYQCGCTLNDEWPEKNHYLLATAGQVIGRWNQRNATFSSYTRTGSELGKPYSRAPGQ